MDSERPVHHPIAQVGLEPADLGLLGDEGGARHGQFLGEAVVGLAQGGAEIVVVAGGPFVHQRLGIGVGRRVVAPKHHEMPCGLGPAALGHGDAHHRGRYRVGVRDQDGAPVHHLVLDRVLVAADHQVGALVAERAQDFGIGRDQVVGEGDHDLGPRLAQRRRGPLRRRDRVVEALDIFGLFHVGGDTEEAGLDAAALEYPAVHQVGIVDHGPAVGATGEADVGPQPMELGLGDTVGEHVGLVELALVELVVAEDGDHAGIEALAAAVQHVEGRDHLLAVVGAAQERGEDGVAPVQHQEVGVLGLEGRAQGPRPRHAAPRTVIDAADAVDVVDGEDGEAAPPPPAARGPGRRRAPPRP